MLVETAVRVNIWEDFAALCPSDASVPLEKVVLIPSPRAMMLPVEASRRAFQDEEPEVEGETGPNRAKPVDMKLKRKYFDNFCVTRILSFLPL